MTRPATESRTHCKLDEARRYALSTTRPIIIEPAKKRMTEKEMGAIFDALHNPNRIIYKIAHAYKGSW